MPVDVIPTSDSSTQANSIRGNLATGASKRRKESDEEIVVGVDDGDDDDDIPDYLKGNPDDKVVVKAEVEMSI